MLHFRSSFRRQIILLISAVCSAFVGGGSPAFGQTTFTGDPRLGTCTHFAQGWDYQKFMPLIEKAGLGWIRDDVGWESLETREKGKYAMPERTLAWIRSAHEHHVRVLAILNGGNRLYADRYDPEAYARCAAWMAKGFAADIDAIEILNEPNNFGFSKYYGGQHDGDGNSPWVAKYVALMNAAAKAIKAANPKMPVIGFGAGAPVTYKQLALGTAAIGNGPAVDAIADHPYSNHSPPEWVPGRASDQRKHFGFATTDEQGTFASLIQGFREQSAKFHGPRGIWLTEWGFTTYQPLTAGQFTGFTESAQAKYIARRFAEGIGLGVDASFLYDFRDDGGNDPGSDHNAEARWGLVRADGQPKPSFWAVTNFSKIIGDYRAAGDGEVGAVNVFPAASWPEQAPIAVYRMIDRQHRPAAMVWATDRADGDLQPRVADVELNWPSDIRNIEAVDMLSGKAESVSFRRASGRLLKDGMTIRDYPVLLREKPASTGGAMVAASGPSPATAAHENGSRDLNLFEPGVHWTFFNGQEFPGATGTFGLATDGGKKTGELGYDFTKGGNYVSTETEVHVGDATGELRVGVRAERALRLSVRLIDRSGQCHQFAEAYSGSGAWETIRIALDRPAAEHWGGANDGKIHFPIEKICLCVNKPAGKNVRGKAEFADLTALGK
ncbi:MAG TPA: hypothetical protein VHX65_00190 [Pirellulales bacterium]|jgi:hypothetical protein|nr:hypothetical protein [Pirellulales bacterium]